MARCTCKNAKVFTPWQASDALLRRALACRALPTGLSHPLRGATPCASACARRKGFGQLQERSAHLRAGMRLPWGLHGGAEPGLFLFRHPTLVLCHVYEIGIGVAASPRRKVKYCGLGASYPRSKPSTPATLASRMTVAGISRQAGHTTASRGSGHIVGRVGRLNEYCFGLSFLLSTLPFRDSFYSSPPPKKKTHQESMSACFCFQLISALLPGAVSAGPGSALDLLA